VKSVKSVPVSHEPRPPSPEQREQAKHPEQAEQPELAQVDDLERHQVLIARSARFAGAFLRWMDANAAEGLTYSRLELLGLLRCEGPAMMRELASGLGITARNMTAMVDALEDAGLVVRRPHPTDRRATLIELTTKGEHAADTALRSGVGRLGRLFDALTIPQQQHFFDSLGVLIEGMERSC
jgi:DNA-binding MarR family transcriptional regulator